MEENMFIYFIGLEKKANIDNTFIMFPAIVDTIFLIIIKRLYSNFDYFI